jgi:hypothetical protein
LYLRFFYRDRIYAGFNQVKTSAHASTGAENGWISEGNIKGSMSSHAQAGNGPARGVFYGAIMLIDKSGYFFGNIGFELHGFIYRTVDVPAAGIAIGANDHDLEIISIFFY